MPTWKLYRDDGTVTETTEKNRWYWELTYTDGGLLKQYGDDGVYHSFYDIDQTKLYSFSMCHDKHPAITIFWRTGMKLIYFWRTRIAKVMGTVGAGGQKKTICAFGYQEGRTKVMFVIDEDDSVYVVDDLEKMEW